MEPLVHSQRGASARDVSSCGLRARALWCAGTLNRSRDRERCCGRRGAAWFQAFQALAEVRSALREATTGEASRLRPFGFGPRAWALLVRFFVARGVPAVSEAGMRS